MNLRYYWKTPPFEVVIGPRVTASYHSYSSNLSNAEAKWKPYIDIWGAVCNITTHSVDRIQFCPREYTSVRQNTILSDRIHFCQTECNWSRGETVETSMLTRLTHWCRVPVPFNWRGVSAWWTRLSNDWHFDSLYFQHFHLYNAKNKRSWRFISSTFQKYCYK